MFDTCKTTKSLSICIDCWNLLYKHIYLFAGYLLWPQKISFRGVSFSRYCGYRDI
ncbi:BnaA08g26820D [Brassica napus]|uniref:(rape) hypothetical protein n=1 Tax=Brassica napus TaxID=3708 RepID=A0A078H0Y1_BRANA|nr:unnamed protein product [Brassica napus]CDY31132.1 BnaA08g26820D [Brassica napus]